MKSSWREIRLGDIIKTNVSNYSKSDNWNYINYLDTGNITNNVINTIVTYNVATDKIPSRAKRKVRKGDIVYSTVRPNQRHFGYITGEIKNLLVSTGFVVLSTNNNLINSKYLYYILSKNEIVNKLHAIGEQSTSAYPSIKPKDIYNMIISLPPLDTQKKIANILSSLDDKIENNRKIAAKLEEIAQALFKRWFLDFNFPNEEGNPYKDSAGEMVESELGMIPMGWDCSSIINPKYSQFITSGLEPFEGEKIYLATASVEGVDVVDRDNLITLKSKPSRANMQPIEYSIWFAKMKDSRKLIRVSKNDLHLIDNYVFSTGFAGIKCNELYFNYLWTYLTTKRFDDVKNYYCNGTTMQAINNQNIRKINIVFPNKEVIFRFNEIANPVYDQISDAKKEIYRLSSIRDILLTKLIRGELMNDN